MGQRITKKNKCPVSQKTSYETTKTRHDLGNAILIFADHIAEVFHVETSG